jgi:hypothetical protein
LPVRTGKAFASTKKREAAPHLAALVKGLWGVISVETAGIIWTLLSLLLIELCPPALIAFVFRPTPAPPIQLSAPKGAGKPSPAAAITQTPARRAAGDVLELLHAAQAGADGWIGPSTQRAMGELIGISGAEVNRQIADLVARQVVAKRAGRSGTYLKLLNPPRNNVISHPATRS